MNTTTMPSAWREVLDGYTSAINAQTSPAELRVRLARLSRFACDIQVAPGDVTAGQFELWVGTLSAATVSSYVKAVRVFYEWAVAAGRCESNPAPARKVARHYTLDAKWQDAIDAFERSQHEEGIKASTTARRVKHVRLFASSSTIAPWLVDHDDYQVWIDSLTAGEATVRTMRDSLRAFYRWGFKAGRVTQDPTMQPDGRYRTLGVSEPWAQPLKQYRLYAIGRGLAPTTVRQHIDLLSNFAREYDGADPFALTMDDIFEYFAGKKWKRETMRSRRNVVRAFYGWAIRTGRCELDPTENMPVVRAGEITARPALVDEYLKALRDATDPRWMLALRLGYEMGLRRAEIAQIHSVDISPGKKGGYWLTVHGKGGKDRRLPIPDRLLPAMRERGEGYLFPSTRGTHVSPRYLGKQLSALLPEGVTAHALRHAFATRIYNINSDVFSVQQLLGHASAATTQRYVHVAGERLQALINEPLEDLVEVMSR